jgi:hypothetical protein
MWGAPEGVFICYGSFEHAPLSHPCYEGQLTSIFHVQFPFSDNDGQRFRPATRVFGA